MKKIKIGQVCVGEFSYTNLGGGGGGETKLDFFVLLKEKKNNVLCAFTKCTSSFLRLIKTAKRINLNLLKT